MASNDDSAAQRVQRIADLTAKLFSEKNATVDNLQAVAEDLNKLQAELNTTKAVSGLGGLLGSFLMFGGLALTPVTGGISTAVTCGMMISASGAAAGLFSAGYEWMKENESMKKAEENIENYKKVLEELSDCLDGIQDEGLIKDMIAELQCAKVRNKVKDTVILILISIQEGIKIRDKTGKFRITLGVTAVRAAIGAVHTMKAVSGGAQFLKAGGLGLSVLTVPLDLHTFVTSVQKLTNKEHSKTATAIKDVAIMLRNEEIVTVTETSETIRVLRGYHEDAVLSDEDYRRIIKRVCGNDISVANAILSGTRRAPDILESLQWKSL